MLIGECDPDQMSPEQRRVHDAIAQGPRGSVPLPFLAMMDAPHLAEALQSVGTAIRFTGAISAELREVAILATAAAFGSGYEWTYHLAIARRFGIPEIVLSAAARELADRRQPIDPAYAKTIALCRDAVLERRVAPGPLSDLVDLIGRTAASEVVAICGYYQALALFLSASGMDQPLVYPDGPQRRAPSVTRPTSPCMNACNNTS